MQELGRRAGITGRGGSPCLAGEHGGPTGAEATIEHPGQEVRVGAVRGHAGDGSAHDAASRVASR